MILLGIDPGLTHTGWGLISCTTNQLSFMACGTISPSPKLEISERLKILHDELAKVIALYKPAESAIEETFVNKNAASSLKLGQARGALILSLSLADLPVYEYSTNLVKKSVVGNGHADKAQIGMMVKTLLPKSDAKSEDAADALAVAIAHAHHRNTKKWTGA